MLVISVYKTSTCTVAWKNGIVLKKDFNIYIRDTFVKMKYFGSDWIRKRV